MSIDEFVEQPGRECIPKLHPQKLNGAAWFRGRQNGITKSILRIFHSQLDFPYPTYSEVPRDVKDSWFKSFAQDFNWPSALSNQVRIAFDRQVKTQYSKNLCEWKQKWRQGKQKPKDVDELVWEGFIMYWKLPETEASSATHSQNRRSPRGTVGMSTHNCGAMTYEAREEMLVMENGGKPIDWLTLMEDTHTNKRTKEIQDPLA